MPKKEPSQFRLIHHLSHPAEASVNDGIDPQVCKVVYTFFDLALQSVHRCGPGALMAKTDKSPPPDFCLSILRVLLVRLSLRGSVFCRLLFAHGLFYLLLLL